MLQYLSERIEQVLKEKSVLFETKKMFGGLCYMVDDKMCLGISTDKASGTARFIGRIGETYYEEALENQHCSEFNTTGRPMKGFIFISAEGVESYNDLQFWVQKCLDYNPFAKKSKK